MATVSFHKDSITIYNSYELTTYKEIEVIIEWLKKSKYFPECLRPIKTKTLVREIMAHNMLYKWGYQVEHTKNTDLNVEPKYRRLLYWILSGIYRMTT